MKGLRRSYPCDEFGCRARLSAEPDRFRETLAANGWTIVKLRQFCPAHGPELYSELVKMPGPTTT